MNVVIGHISEYNLKNYKNIRKEIVMDTKIIALFNHKGGVSKTTMTYHIGWKLSTMGKKVLLGRGRTHNVILQACYSADNLMNTTKMMHKEQ